MTSFSREVCILFDSYLSEGVSDNVLEAVIEFN